MNNTTRQPQPDIGTGDSKLPVSQGAPPTQTSANHTLQAQCVAALLTKAQFAERIQVCPRSVDALLAAKKIPFLRITGRMIRIQIGRAHV